jgi:hypothetical protein
MRVDANKNSVSIEDSDDSSDEDSEEDRDSDSDNSVTVEKPFSNRPVNTQPDEKKSKGILEWAKSRLDNLSFHPVENAFLARKIRFGLDPRNIWGANPIDLMHAYQSGVLMYLVKMVLDTLPPTKQVALDRLVDKLFHNLRCGEKDDYPRLSFAKGFSKLSLLTSDEWAGKLFVLVLVLHTDEGKEIFDKTSIFERDDKVVADDAFLNKGSTAEEQQRAADYFDDLASKLNRKQLDEIKAQWSRVPKTVTEEAKMEKNSKLNKKEEELESCSKPCSINDFTVLAEALLCFHAWYKRGMYQLTEDGMLDTNLIGASIRRMLAMIRYYWPRKKGNGWKIQKFHDILHLAIDMERFGAPSNFDAGPCESGLRFWAKLPALTSQKRGYNTFAQQVAARTYEYQCIAKALRSNGVLSVRDEQFQRSCGKGSDKKCETTNGSDVCLGGTTYRVFNNKLDAKDGASREGDQSSRSDGNGNGKSSVAIFPQSRAVGRKKNAKGMFSVHPVIENFLRFQPKDSIDSTPPKRIGTDIYWELRTELTTTLRDEEEKVTLRCHPNYRNEGPWYDWVMVNFEVSDDTVFQRENDRRVSFRKFIRQGKKEKDWKPIKHETQYEDCVVPCKLLAFWQNPDDPKDIRALVHGCDFRTNSDQTDHDTVLFEFWQLSYHDLHRYLPEALRDRGNDGSRLGNRKKKYAVPNLAWVDIDSIVTRCLVIEEEPGVHEVVPETRKGKEKRWVILVRKHNLWPEQFN